MADTATITESATADAVRELLEADEATARAYLAESFLTEAMLALFHARRDAHLTQEQVAKTMGTRQAAITRWERDFTGSISLRKYVEFALACGKLPFDMLLAPVSTVRDFAIAHPSGPLTVDAYSSWKGAQLAQADNNPQTITAPIPLLPTSGIDTATVSIRVEGELNSLYSPQQNFTLSQQRAARGSRVERGTGIGNSLVSDSGVAA